MGKLILVWSLLFNMFLWGDNLKNACLSCHISQQIPNHLVYRRYLLQYSTAKNMEEAMLMYLKNPKKEKSIMPPQFFLKFPMKTKLPMDENTLRQNIQQFIQKFDVKKKLILEQNSR